MLSWKQEEMTTDSDWVRFFQIACVAVNRIVNSRLNFAAVYGYLKPSGGITDAGVIIVGLIGESINWQKAVILCIYAVQYSPEYSLLQNYEWKNAEKSVR